MIVYRFWSLALTMGAYCPLFVFLSLLGFSWPLWPVTPNHLMEWITLFAVVLSAISLIFVKLLMSHTIKKSVGEIGQKIVTISRRDQDVLAYLVSYIIPLTTITTTSWTGTSAFLLILALILFLSKSL